jgi:hypothetical protein
MVLVALLPVLTHRRYQRNRSRAEIAQGPRGQRARFIRVVAQGPRGQRARFIRVVDGSGQKTMASPFRGSGWSS